MGGSISLPLPLIQITLYVVSGQAAYNPWRICYLVFNLSVIYFFSWSPNKSPRTPAAIIASFSVFCLFFSCHTGLRLLAEALDAVVVIPVLCSPRCYLGIVGSQEGLGGSGGIVFFPAALGDLMLQHKS